MSMSGVSVALSDRDRYHARPLKPILYGAYLEPIWPRCESVFTDLKCCRSLVLDATGTRTRSCNTFCNDQNSRTLKDPFLAYTCDSYTSVTIFTRS